MHHPALVCCKNSSGEFSALCDHAWTFTTSLNMSHFNLNARMVRRGRHSTYSLHRKKITKMPLSVRWSEQNYKWMQPSAKCLCWIGCISPTKYNDRMTTLSHRLFCLFGCLFCRAICLFKSFFKKSFMLFNLSDVWWNPNVFNFTVSFTRHSAGLHRCDTGVRWPSLGYFELRATDQLSPGAPVWPPGPHIACEATHGHQTQREMLLSGSF